MSAVLGWDIGGANIKVASVEGAGATRVLEIPFPLWREPNRLTHVLKQAADRVGTADLMAVTMTAELADCFATKREGVSFVLDAVRSAFPGAAVHVYGVDGTFRWIDEARMVPHVIAAANWRASAAVVARSFPDAIFVDAGSTTTDIIPVVAGQVVARGHTDTTRLQSGELVYTGALRTPVFAVVRSVPVDGRRCSVAAEYFAITADVYRWLGRIGEEDYTCDTPDGRGKSREESGARLARVVCADLESLGEARVNVIAEEIARRQVGQIASGLRRVLRRFDRGSGANASLLAVLAGQGVFLGRAAAERCGLKTRDLAGALGHDSARAAPAIAVAILLAEQLGR